jgi:anthranilate/para-aminobenzoate synthase component I
VARGIVRSGSRTFEAGIVADSIPEKEWQETLDKAAGLVLAASLPPRME